MNKLEKKWRYKSNQKQSNFAQRQNRLIKKRFEQKYNVQTEERYFPLGTGFGRQPRITFHECIRPKVTISQRFSFCKITRGYRIIGKRKTRILRTSSRRTEGKGRWIIARRNFAIKFVTKKKSKKQKRKKDSEFASDYDDCSPIIKLSLPLLRTLNDTPWSSTSVVLSKGERNLFAGPAVSCRSGITVIIKNLTN